MRKNLLLLAIAPTIAFSLAACDVKKTQEGEAPKVNVEGGQVPKYDVDAPDVSVDSKKEQVDVPTVGTQEKTIRVPDVNVDMKDKKVDVPVVGTQKEEVKVPDVNVTPADADKK